MQHGESHLSIVSNLRGLRLYRGPYATYCKRAAQRCHRHRVAVDLKLIARQAKDPEDFEGQPVKSETCTDWDIF